MAARLILFGVLYFLVLLHYEKHSLELLLAEQTSREWEATREHARPASAYREAEGSAA